MAQDFVEEQKPNIANIRRRAGAGALRATVHAQVEVAALREASSGKEFCEVRIRDGGDALVLRAWRDSPFFDYCRSLKAGDCVALDGEFQVHPKFGFEARNWRIRDLDEAEAAMLFAGDPADVRTLEEDLGFIAARMAEVADPRLRCLAEKFLATCGTRFRRAAAARNFHHARRGGLAAHTAQMLRAGLALCSVYPSLNRDLLATGVVFHDCGKLWETCPPECGFEIPPDRRGELLGHISIGVELVNRLWSEIEEQRAAWSDLDPPSEDVRLHLLHLVASHHGELEFGSPVQPKTPEAFALHHLDNLDARLEMLATGYAKSPELAPGIFERIRPLGHSIVAPLPAFRQPPEQAPSSQS